MDKKQKKQLDLNVVRLLQTNGIFNYIHAHTVTEISAAVQSSNIDAYKFFKNIKTDPDNLIAQQVVLQYLQRHKMTETLRCIALETKNRMSPGGIPKEVQTNLDISEKENVLYHIVNLYMTKMETIVSENQNKLKKKITDRLNNLDNAPPSKPSPQSKPQAKTTSPKPSSLSMVGDDDFDDFSSTQNKKTAPSPQKQESSSIDFDMDFDNDDIPSPSKKTPTTSQNPKSTQKISESSEPDLSFDDSAPSSKMPVRPKGSPVNAAKPSNVVPAGNSFDQSSDFDSYLNDTPPPSKPTTTSTNAKPAAKPIVQSKNEGSDSFNFDDDDDEPPMLKTAQAKNAPQAITNESSGFDDLDLDLG